MSEFLDSLIERKIVTDTTSIEDLQAEAGGSGSSSSSPLKTFVDLFMGTDIPDDYVVCLRLDGEPCEIDESNGTVTVVSSMLGDYEFDESEHALGRSDLKYYKMPGSITGSVAVYDIENKMFTIPGVESSSINGSTKSSFILIPIALSLFNNMNAMHTDYNTSFGICMYNTEDCVEKLKTSISKRSITSSITLTPITYGELVNY